MIFADSLPAESLKNIKGKNWYRHGIYRTILLWAVELLPGLSKESFAQEGISKGIENAIEIGGEFFIVQDEFDKFCELYDEKLKTGIPYLKDYIDHYQRDNDAALNASKEIGRIDVSKLTNGELGELFLKHFECIQPLHHWLWSMEFLNESFDRKIRALTTEVYPSWKSTEIDAFLGSVSYTSKRHFFQKEQEAIVALDSIDDPQFPAIFEEYKWLKMYFIDESPFSPSEYRTRADEMLKNKADIQAQIEKGKFDAQKAKELIGGVQDKELQEYLFLMQELSYLKTYRIDVYTLTFYYVLRMRDEIIKRLSMSFDDLMLHTKQEVVDALNGSSVSKEEINQRKTWAVVMADTKMEFVKGDGVRQVKQTIWNEDERAELIKGTIAYQGVVRGRVRVSFSSKDIHRIEQGDILVCNLTNPDYNSIFKKLAGIVTDEGGVLCHSAIMAREFKIPCVIGTKIATKVLKDGDMVEVDADKGIVRIIK